MTHLQPPAAALSGATTRAFDQLGGRIEGEGSNQTARAQSTDRLAEAREEAFRLLQSATHYAHIVQLNLEIADDVGAVYAGRQARDYFTSAVRHLSVLRQGLAERIVAEPRQ